MIVVGAESAEMRRKMLYVRRSVFESRSVSAIRPVPRSSPDRGHVRTSAAR